MIRVKKYYRPLIFGILVLLLVACSSQNNNPSSLRIMAEKLAQNNVGAIVEIKENNSAVPIIIFEEIHTSLVGNIEIAIMLSRLQHEYNVTLVGTEGAYSTLDASWYHTLFGSDSDATSAVVQQLAEGEIGSIEMMALLYADVTVQGLEDQAEYETDLADAKAGGAAVPYFLAFAAQNMTDADKDHANQIRSGQGEQAFINYVLSFDVWSEARYNTLYGFEPAPAAELVHVMDDVIRRAEQTDLYELENFTVYAVTLKQERSFFEGVDQRTSTMFDNLRALFESYPDVPLPVVVGISHTPRLVELLNQAGYSYIVLQPASLEKVVSHDASAVLLDDAAFARKFNGQSVDGDMGLGALLDGRTLDNTIRPMPDVTSVLRRQKIACYTAFRKLGSLLRNNIVSGNIQADAPLANLDTILQAMRLTGVQIAANTVERVSADPSQPVSTTNQALIFQVSIPSLSGTGIDTFWAKITYVDEVAQIQELERLLLQTKQGVKEGANRRGNQNPTIIPVGTDILTVVGPTRESVLTQVLTEAR